MSKPKYRLPLNLQFFSEGGENPPVTPLEGGDPSVTNPETTPPANQEPPAHPPVAFTQEQVEEAKQKQEAAFLKKLGVESLDQLKQTVTGWKEYQESQKTEQEKTNEKLTTFETQLKEKDESLFNLQAENAAIKSGITEEKNLSAVITLAKTKVNDDVDITKAIEMVVEEFPHFKGVVEEPPANSVKKPTFSNGQHQQTTMTESEKWAAAFGIKQQ